MSSKLINSWVCKSCGKENPNIGWDRVTEHAQQVTYIVLWRCLKCRHLRWEAGTALKGVGTK